MRRIAIPKPPCVLKCVLNWQLGYTRSLTNLWQCRTSYHHRRNEVLGLNLKFVELSFKVKQKQKATLKVKAKHVQRSQDNEQYEIVVVLASKAKPKNTASIAKNIVQLTKMEGVEY